MNAPVAVPREVSVKTPTPPPQGHIVSTVTPSNSMANQLLNDRSHLSSMSNHAMKDASTYLSDDTRQRSDVSDHSSTSFLNGGSGMAMECDQSEQIVLKHPLCAPESHKSPHLQVNQQGFRLSPRRRTTSLPPILDRNSFHEPSGCNLAMRKESDRYDRRQGFYYEEDERYFHHTSQNYVPNNHISENEARWRRVEHVHHPYVAYERHHYHQYNRDVPTPPPRPPQAPGIFYQRGPEVHDYPPEHALREKRYMDGRRGAFMPSYRGMGPGWREVIYAHNDVYEEMRQPYHAKRYCHPDDAHNYPAACRNHYEPYPRPNRLIQHEPEIKAVVQSREDDQIQYQRHSRTIGSIDVDRSNGSDYPMLPYQQPLEGNYTDRNGDKKTLHVLRKKCAWKNYPELEQFLIDNREEYLKYSAKNYTTEQKQYNNRLTERLLEVAAKHNYMFDPKDFNFVTVRDRIRCYYKSYVQSNKKRGIVVGYSAMGSKKKQKCENDLDEEVAQDDISANTQLPSVSNKNCENVTNNKLNVPMGR